MRYLWCQLRWVDNKHGGARAVEFIICHVEISIAFVEEKKIPELLKTFPNASKFLKTLVAGFEVCNSQFGSYSSSNLFGQIGRSSCFFGFGQF
ncbi:long chain acyl-CoA synthetase 5-like isoform X1 [Arachis hypogaea]|uniref:long chain acyl-CoA synthetase 5-like isoform X1 n=1 Tax=Arachis hypogaea TaxID=3818 RepID=UPI003B20B9E6